MVVSIHAIATFQALNDYLRPRVAGLASSGRLSNMLAALAASGFGPGAASRADHEANQVAAAPVAPSSSPDAPPPPNEVRRRRSQRLSVKNATSSSAVISDNAPPATTTPASALDSISRQREELLIQESGLAAELTDDEVDAEVGSDSASADVF